jgi:hypothetical protein
MMVAPKDLTATECFPLIVDDDHVDRAGDGWLANA